MQIVNLTCLSILLKSFTFRCKLQAEARAEISSSGPFTSRSLSTVLLMLEGLSKIALAAYNFPLCLSLHEMHCPLLLKATDGLLPNMP